MAECKQCPAFIYAEESLRTGLCAGCRAGPPEMTVETKLAVVAKRAEFVDDVFERAYRAIGACDIGNFLAKCEQAKDYDDVKEERDRLRAFCEGLEHWLVVGMGLFDDDSQQILDGVRVALGKQPEAK